MNTKATLTVFKSPRDTMSVVIQNCSGEVITLLSRFDIWGSSGKLEYHNTTERPKIWFECPIEFLDFVESDMGRVVFRRMGVEVFRTKNPNPTTEDEFIEI